MLRRSATGRPRLGSTQPELALAALAEHAADIGGAVRESGGSRTRTWDLRFWRPALPPAELIPQGGSQSSAAPEARERDVWCDRPTLTPRALRPPPGRRGDASAPRRLDEHQLPPVQHLRDGAGLLDLRVRVADRVVQGLDVDTWDLHDVVSSSRFDSLRTIGPPGSPVEVRDEHATQPGRLCSGRRRGYHRPRPTRAKCCGCTGAFQAPRAGSIPVARSAARHIGEWRSLVAHPAGGRAVAGSNPVSPIRKGCPGEARHGPPGHPQTALERGLRGRPDLTRRDFSGGSEPPETGPSQYMFDTDVSRGALEPERAPRTKRGSAPACARNVLGIAPL
jgi:hypothetical protein